MADARQREWLTCEQFAELAGLPVRTARHAIAKAAAGSPVKRWPLETRTSVGRGGRAGVRYEVALSSLSVGIQNAFRGLSDASRASLPAVIEAEPRRIASTPQGAIIDQKMEVLAAIVQHAPGSAARAVAIAAQVRPDLSLRTLQRWASEYDQHDGDLTYLARKRPSDAGVRRVMVSRAFDKAFKARGYDIAQLAHWGERRDQLIKDVWASPVQRAGWRRVRLEVATFLKRECLAADVKLPASAFHLSQRAIVETAYYREVDVYKHDRKTWDDGKSRIRRDRSMWKPLEEVVLDVHHIDVVVTRPNGQDVYPKMVAFQDSGTSRMFLHIVFPPKGEMVRQEHVLAAFLDMVQHPDWGLPQRIYMDNGSENLKLIKIEPLLAMINAAGLKTIVKARPYSGASKPIESKFALLIQHIFSQMDGYVGSDRTNKKSEKLGRPTKPYPHGFDEFQDEVRLRLIDLEDQPIGSGTLAGRSPRQIFEDHCAAGWQRVGVDQLALDATFCDTITPKVDRGMVRIAGGVFRHPDLPNGRRITVARSFRRGALPLAKLPGGGWVELQEDMPFAPWASDGAIEARRLQSRDGKRVAKMRAETKAPDLTGNMAFRVGRQPARLPSAATAAPLMDVIASSQAEEMAAARTEGAQVRLLRPDPAQQRAARRMAETEELERYLASKRA